jgi:hypothetical protein
MVGVAGCVPILRASSYPFVNQVVSARLIAFLVAEVFDL